MREIITDVLASPVPVIGYVAPSGAHAASAGTYILYATHIAVMAPGTNVGAATPVQIGGSIPGLPSGTPDKESKDKKDGDRQPEPKDAMTAKATNDAVAFIRSLAELRGRNADWAEKAVREAATLTANGALQANVIDLIARDPAELLKQVDGRAWWRLLVAGRNAWRRRMPSSKPSIPDGSRDSWPSSPIPTSRSFS
jgi:membrane-bound serine protease (ClpP class)